jgi:DnaK suppressor protein
MTHLTDIQIAELKDSLMVEKEALEAHFDAERDDEGDSLVAAAGELSSVDNHPADLGTETFERGRDQAIDETMDEQLDQINRSLEQMKAGAYGICQVCDAEIPFERLQAIPYVTTCIEHAKQADSNEMEEGRPVEEQVMTIPPAGAGKNRQSRAGHFDDADAWQTVESYEQLSSDKADKSDLVEGTDALAKE